MKISIINIIIIFSLKCIIINSQLISHSQNVEEQKTDIIVSTYNLFMERNPHQCNFLQLNFELC